MGTRMTKKKQAAIARASFMYPVLEYDDLSISEFESDSDDTTSNMNHVKKNIQETILPEEIVEGYSDSESVDQLAHKKQPPSGSSVRKREMKDSGIHTSKRPHYNEDIPTETEHVLQELRNVGDEQEVQIEAVSVDLHATSADDISEFSDTNILDDLDDWRPTPSTHQHLSQTRSLMSIQSFDSDVDREEEILEEKERKALVSVRHHIPDLPFDITPTAFRPVYPHPITDRQVRHIKEIKPLTLEASGLANQAREVALDETKDFMKWERSVKATMAHHGSVTWAVFHSKEARLFRMTDTWSENGVIFSWCVPVTDEEQETLKSSTQSQQDDDSVKDIFSQPHVLPSYVPNENDDKYLFGFFFLHSNITSTTEKDFMKETLVGIWPPWTHYTDKLSGSEKKEVFMATRFMANCMH
ncbi:hypothetical protein J3Q64DRAFT_1704483 [Phycomyces blakesleeanus]|uniref:Uncharacterized protein n=2 Tax=Phycomyces blakesleeanus TaxID=4837 RepID=A0A162NIK9_PHYB8|nr:hypothetical protein PHYBLDRAFT_149177 [Phycomyces blakesleeanus NRRL 1555(-)]OAD70014.1 hypothetical protein PHYBLDRAFT_149177 [Phycomyces blakesleeanus NRRL 1555(-)]|eukprot:XP_018288054.1 hypothetical protein PHYBLDRAFT_149177 [Phycomyces blakesleeanus NRRL 1555(-)]